MKRSTFFAVTGVLAVLFGAGFLALPAMALSHYGVPTEPHNLMQARHFGATMLMVGLVVWLARTTQDPTAVQALLIGTGIGEALGAVLSAWAAVSGLQNAMAWSSVALYGLLCLGCLYFLAAPASRMAQSG
jgi:uncharacterized membrane protein YfcA